jgi:hypothetical protein
VSQCRFTDGLVSVRALGSVASLGLVPVLMRDPVAPGPRPEPALRSPGSLALIATPDALRGDEALVGRGRRS